MILSNNILGETVKTTLDNKTHAWRTCPIGKHFVKKHITHVPPSKEHPDGNTIEVQEHCATNPSEKDILSFDEIQVMTEKYFHQLSGPPKAGVLKGYGNADKFDVEIRGWTQTIADYKGILEKLPHKWMEIFQHHYLCIIEGC